jgi:tyrosyl-tRNA synthetase
MDALNILRERGFLKAITHEEELQSQLIKEPTSFYVGIDPTGTSLHIGHLVPILASVHLSRAGHRPIFVLGGGTALIGDPSGKIEMRSIQTKEKIASQAQVISQQIIELVQSLGVEDFLIVNNADWLVDLNYIDFLRDIGRHFSVNRMLSFETYKKRLETGLSFIEFNYQLLQSYDFLQLFQRHHCLLQLGGDDQWGNIVAGVDLIRRVEGGQAYGMTFNLVTRSDGKKMGKTEKGAIFLDATQTSAYDMYQYWRNVTDADVRKFLLLYTFLSEGEIEDLTREGGVALNHAKEVLAFEATQIIHSREKAEEARAMAKSLFGGSEGDNAPQVLIKRESLSAQMTIVDFCVIIGLCSSKGEARRMIEGGGLYLDNERVSDASSEALVPFLARDSVLVRQGKKKYIKVVLS